MKKEAKNILNSKYLLVFVILIILFFIVTALPIITLTPPTLSNNSYTNNNWVFVNITSNENLNQSLLEWGNSSGFANVTMSNSSLTNWYKNMTNLVDYTYNYTIWAQNTTGNWNQSGRYFITVDTISPNINFTSPTPDNGSSQSETSVYVNVTTNDTNDHSAWIDWNYSLVGWWAMDFYNDTGIFDNSSYGNFGKFKSGLSTSNITSSGKRGKGLEFDGVDDYVDCGGSSPWNTFDNLSVSFWFKTRGSNNDFLFNKFYGYEDAWGMKIASNWLVIYDDIDDVATERYGSGININTWYHVVASLEYNGSGGYENKLYKNGKLIGSGQHSNASWSSFGGNFYIGARLSNGANSFNGTIDEVMIFSRALTPEEINASYNAGSYRLYNNFTNLSDGTYNYKAYAIDAAGNINSTEEREITIDTISPNINFTSPTPDNGSSQSENSVYVNVTTNDTNDHSAWIDWNYSLVGWWAMDFYNDTGIFDNSSYGNFGTFVGGLGTDNITSGKRGKGLKFDGNDDYVDVGSFDGLSNDTYTISLWFYKRDDVGGIFMWGGVTSGTSTERIYFLGQSNKRIQILDDYNVSYITSSNAIELNKWEHVVYTYDYSNQNMSLYLNGQYVGGDSSFNQTPDTIYDLQVGARDGLINFNGTIDEVMIWNRVLSAEEINATYNAGIYKLYNNFTNLDAGTYNYKAYTIDAAGNTNQTEERTITITAADTTSPNINFTNPTPDNDTTTTNTSIEINVSITESSLNEVIWNWNSTNYTIYNDSLVLMMNFDNVSALGENDTHVVDLSGNGNDGTTSGNPVWNSTGRYRGAFEFDGDGDYINISNTSSLAQIGSGDYSIGVWIKTTSTSSSDRVIIHAAEDFVKWWRIMYEPLTDTLTFGDDDNITKSTIEAIVDLNDGYWHYIVAVQNFGTNHELFVDGISVGTSPDNGDSSSGSNVCIAEATDKSDWHGTIDEVRIYNRSLSAEEINQSYMSNLYKYDTNKWALYINQSKTPISGLDDGNYTYQAFASDSSNNWNQTEERSITIEADNEYPQFSNYWDDNATLIDSGDGHFNVTIEKTNGTVLLEIDGNNITATNLTSNVYNATYTFSSSGDYIYRWHSWGNGSSNNYNVSVDRNYTVNATPDTVAPLVYLESPANNILNTTDNTPDFTFNTTDETASTLDCTLWLNSTTPTAYGNNASVLNATSTTITANAPLANDDYWWWINCSDGTNTNISEKRNISINLPPSIASVLSYPANSSTDSDGNITFECNATATNSQIVNISLYINFTTWHLNQTNTVSGTQNSTTFTLNNIPDGTSILWNCLACNNESNCSFADNNWTVTVGDAYYIDATTGNDSNNGTSPSSAWQTWSKVKAQSYSAGDTIKFKRGETWDIAKGNEWTFTYDGTSGNYITIGDYGTGNKPVWEGREVVGSQTGDWTEESANKWYTTGQTNTIYRCWLDSLESAEADSVLGIDGSTYYWYYDGVSSRIYVYSVGNPATSYPNIRVARIDWNIRFNGANYINVHNIDMRGGGSNIYVDGNSAYITIENNNLTYTGRSDSAGIYLKSGSEIIHHFVIRNNIIDCHQRFVDNAVGEDKKACNNGIYLRSAVHDSTIESNEIRDYGHTGISLLGDQSGADGIHDNIIQDNLIDGSYSHYMRGFELLGLENKCINNTFRRNKIQNTNIRNHLCGNNNLIYNNLIINTTESTAIGVSDSSEGFNLQTWDSYVCHDNKIYNNILYRIFNECVRLTQSGGDVKNNLIKNNIFVKCGEGGDAPNKSIMWWSSVNQPNQFEYNCFYDTDTQDVISYKGTVYTVAEADSGLADFSNNIGSDPLLDANYRLQAGSPCIDTGIDLSSVFTTDKDGITRPIDGDLNGSAEWDIGAYEYIPTNVTVTLNSPSNGTSTSNTTITFNCSATDDINLANITLYGNWSGGWHTNETVNISGTSNSTTFTKNLTEGIYIWNCLAYDNDSNSDWGDSNYTLTIDASAPSINITYPPNNSNFTTNSVNVNYSVSDNPQSCWYSNDTMSVNTTLSNCVNITTITWSEGQHNVTVWANDSAGNENSSSVTFFIDSIKPTIQFVNPTETNGDFVSRNYIEVNVTANDTNLDSILIRLYNSTHVQINSSTTSSSPNYINFSGLSNGIYYFNTTANDTLGNENYTSTRNITLDTINPTLNLVSPANNSESSSTNIIFTYNVTDTNSISNCSLIINGIVNQTNTSITKNTNQTFSQTLTNGNYNWSVNCTDIANNIGASGTYNLSVSDTTSPNISLVSPANSSTWTSSSTVTFNYNVSDASSISNCSLLINNAIDQTDTSITKDTTQPFSKSLSNANYNWSVRCYDTAGNVGNSSVYYLTVSYTAPDGNGGNGGGGGGTTTNITEEIHSWTTITPGVATIMKDFDPELGIKQIQIEVNNEAQNVKITVTKYDDKPANVSLEKTGKVYKYLQIETENLEDKLNRSVITIQVEKNWTFENNVERNNMAMFKFNESLEDWNELETVYTEENESYYYYDVELDSFSYFAIAAKVVEEPEVGEEIGIREKIREIVNRFIEVIKPYWLWILIGVGSVIVIVVGIIVVLKMRKGGGSFKKKISKKPGTEERLGISKK